MKALCVYCGSNLGTDDAYVAAARRLGRLLAGHDIGLVYGGASKGLMGELADAVIAAGGSVRGVIPQALVDREIAHPGLDELHVVASMLERREELEVGLRHALVRGEFVLHYQPRVEVGSGRVIGFEALLRWQHPRFGLLPPGRFLPILESSGLIHSTGEWVVDTACRQLAYWQRRFELPDLAISINLSPQQLMHGRMVEAVAKSISSVSLDPGCIEFEIGDSDIIHARSSEAATLKGLRSLGVRLSLDHFGVRDVSFRSLDDGAIDSFIIDQSLICDVADNGAHQRIVRAAIAMARGLDIEVAAEGVETMPQLEFLKSCHCDLVQGFLIGGPMEAAKASAVLQSEISGSSLLRR